MPDTGSLLVLGGDVGRHRPGTPAYRRTLTGLMMGGLANFALLYYVQPLLPTLSAHYGVSPAQSAQALSISTLALALGLLVVGPLADRIGRVPVMRWSLLASGVFGVASAFAPTWETLLILRAADGIVLAGLPAVALAYLREEVDEAHHLQANAAYITGTALGGAIGRLLPGFLAALGGWTLATSTMGLLTLVAAAAVWMLVPPSRGFTPRPVSIGRTLRGTVVAVRDPVVALLCGVGFAMSGTFVGIYNAVAFRLEAPPFLVGAAVVLIYLAYLPGILAPLAMGLVARRIGRGATMLMSLALLTAGVAVMAVPVVAAIVTGMALITVAFLGTHSLATGWVVDRAHRRGSGTAQASSAYLLAFYFGSAVIGVLAVWQWEVSGWLGVSILSLALCVVGLVAAVAAGRLDGRLGLRHGAPTT